MVELAKSTVVRIRPYGNILIPSHSKTQERFQETKNMSQSYSRTALLYIRTIIVAVCGLVSLLRFILLQGFLYIPDIDSAPSAELGCVHRTQNDARNSGHLRSRIRLVVLRVPDQYTIAVAAISLENVLTLLYRVSSCCRSGFVRDKFPQSK